MKELVGLLVFAAVCPAQTVSAPRPPQSLADWEAMIPTIRQVLKTESSRNAGFHGIEENYPIRIRRIADLTGDGLPEAMVYLGTGGASTDELTFMRIELGKPVLARFRSQKGKISSMVFVRGASVMHTDGVDMLPEERSILSFHYDYNGRGGRLRCNGDAYTWTPHSKTFDYNPALSKRLTKATCSEVPKTVRPG